MANIFENKLRKKVPETLSECVVADNTAKELFSTAARIEARAKISGSATAVIGLIISIILGSTFGEQGFIIFLIGLLATALISYAIYYPQHFSALQICAFATILHNTNITANLQMYYLQEKTGEKIIVDDKSDIIPPMTKIEVVPITVVNNTALVKCPNCNQILEFDKGFIDGICPHCNEEFHIKYN